MVYRKTTRVVQYWTRTSDPSLMKGRIESRIRVRDIDKRSWLTAKDGSEAMNDIHFDSELARCIAAVELCVLLKTAVISI
jgi:hypothetical protein